jgi:2-keto-4-pentenoate hydratase/2-oxohepta-3-ene-1,7-dioic acid hydratase in catechol pathway
MLEIIARFAGDDELIALYDRRTRAIPLSEVAFDAPLPRPPRNILCVGKNYQAHAEEFDRSGITAERDSSSRSAMSDAPIIFTKPPEAVIGPRDPIRLPSQITQRLDYEAELAVVIGRPGRRIRAEDAEHHVFGYTIINDVTARDLQARHQQWFLGKALDGSCPMGPWIVTPDELGEKPQRIRCWVNGELRQDASTGDMLFDVPTLIATISAAMTLQAGDVIATGTPAGVGIGLDPPRFLADGDRIDIEVSGIGTLSNGVREDHV